MPKTPLDLKIAQKNSTDNLCTLAIGKLESRNLNSYMQLREQTVIRFIFFKIPKPLKMITKTAWNWKPIKNHSTLGMKKYDKKLQCC